MRNLSSIVGACALLLASAGSGLAGEKPEEALAATIAGCTEKNVDRCPGFNELLDLCKENKKSMRRLVETGAPKVRSAVLRIMGRIGADRATVELLLKDFNDEIRIGAIGLAANTGQKKLSPTILVLAEDAALRGDQRELLKGIQAVGKLGYQPALDFLLRMSEDERRKVSRAAFLALGELGGKESVKVLVVAASDTQAGEATRLAAIEALGRAGSKPAVKVLLELAEGGDLTYRIGAVKALRWSENPKAVGRLSKLLGDKEVRAHAIEALGAIGGKKAGKALLALHADENMDADNRFEAVAAAAMARDKKASEPLRIYLTSPDEKRRVKTMRALASLGRSADVPSLFEAYKKASGREQGIALWAIKVCSGRTLESQEDIEKYIKKKKLR